MWHREHLNHKEYSISYLSMSIPNVLVLYNYLVVHII